MTTGLATMDKATMKWTSLHPAEHHLKKLNPKKAFQLNKTSYFFLNTTQLQAGGSFSHTLELLTEQSSLPSRVWIQVPLFPDEDLLEHPAGSIQ